MLSVEERSILSGMKAALSKGWTKGVLSRWEEDGSTEVCLYGALVKAANLPMSVCDGPGVEGRTNRSGPQYVMNIASPAMRVIDLIAAEVGVSWQQLALWNDAEERTVDDIIDVIDRLLNRDTQKIERKDTSREGELIPA